MGNRSSVQNNINVVKVSKPQSNNVEDPNENSSRSSNDYGNFVLSSPTPDLEEVQRRLDIEKLKKKLNNNGGSRGSSRRNSRCGSSGCPTPRKSGNSTPTYARRILNAIHSGVELEEDTKGSLFVFFQSQT